MASVRAPQAVLQALEGACRRYPDQRVMQVIVNALGEDPFYVEDLSAVEQLNAYGYPDSNALRQERAHD